MRFLWFLLLLVASFVILRGSGGANDQPIRYNHKAHIEGGFECSECHLNVETQARTSLPNIEICVDCHDDLEAENPEERKVAGFVTEKVRIPWVQIHSVPDYAYFSHRRHVTLGEIECESCHGAVSEMTQPFVQPFVEINMDWCVGCHEQRAVSVDCVACHR